LAGSFSAGVKRRVEDRKRRLHAAGREFVLDIGDRLIEGSPVVTGRFRSNWYLGVDNVVRTTTELVDIPHVNNLETIPEKAGGHVYYFSNALPYAMRIEYGFRGPDSLGRVYNQPPAMVVGLTIGESPQIARRAAAKVKAGR